MLNRSVLHNMGNLLFRTSTAWSSTLATVLFALFVGSAHASVIFQFRGEVVSGISAGGSCVGLCGNTVPVVGSPISIAVALDAHQPPFAGSASSGTDTLYDMTGPSLLDFGYGAPYAFSEFQVRVVDNNLNSAAPDQLLISRVQPSLLNKPDGAAWFTIEFLSPGVDLLEGSGLPGSIDLLLAPIARGTLFFSANGQSSESAFFEIRQVISSVPEPSTLALFALCLFGLLLARRARSLGP